MADTPAALQCTPLHASHVAAGGQMVPFAGWEMPVQYAGRGLVAEHLATRTAVGLFDVSHMGEIVIEGPGALDEVQGLVTNDATRLQDGDAMYALLCHADGGTVDDLYVYRLGAERFLLVVNASNIAKDFAHMQAHAARPERVRDRSTDFAQIAVQGPRARELLARVATGDALDLPRNKLRVHDFHGADLLVATTGYTGEPGYEVYLPPELAADFWSACMDAGSDLGVCPVGLGARDTLRLEMGYALYGHELDDATNAYEARLGWAVKLLKGAFVGSEALARVKTDGPRRRLVGLAMLDRGIAREGHPVLHAGRRVGGVTSGTHAPSRKAAIALAYVEADFAAPGTCLEVEIRGKPVRAEVVTYPFVQTALTAP
ncbi:MAG: glycine cleavage system aminomethyltransferase GcvT [Myxococcales bacterium]|nr:glycine cleavage system aminomethyltransferase GcvT [Myxococcales bacterium]